MSQRPASAPHLLCMCARPPCDRRQAYPHTGIGLDCDWGRTQCGLLLRGQSGVHNKDVADCLRFFAICFVDGSVWCLLSCRLHGGAGEQENAMLRFSNTSRRSNNSERLRKSNAYNGEFNRQRRALHLCFSHISKPPQAKTPGDLQSIAKPKVRE
jgi:hypothetical protein